MKYRSLALIVAVCCLSISHAFDTSYYREATGKKQAALKTALYKIMGNPTTKNYGELWYWYYDTDRRSDKSCIDRYSNEVRYFSSQNGSALSGMNKEHGIAQSWWGGGTTGIGADLQHVMPSDTEANSKKSNYGMGVVTQQSWTNGSIKVGKGYAGNNGLVNMWEPADKWKGDFARIYFYMASCYQDYNWATTTMLTNSDWRTLNAWSIELLLRWARQDPVSEKERNRNDAVQIYQNNRNPFVDNPDLMEYIWGDKVGTGFVEGGEDPGPGPGPDPEPTDVATLISPTQGTILEFGDVALGDSATLTLYVRGEHFTSPLTLKCYLNNYTMFSLSTTSIDTTSLNSLEGYPLEVTYKPTSLGEHKAKILFSGGGLSQSVGIQLRATCVESTAPELLGDVNGDGTVDISDVNIVINLMLGKDTSEDFDGDINEDGNVDISDVNMVINLMLGKGF